jgi:outer membrane protein assembly factor BamB
MSRSTLALLVLCGLLDHGAAAAAGERYEVRWKLASGGVWPPALVNGRLILKTGDTLAAHRLDTGQVIWTQRIKNLRYGEGVLAAGPRFVYVLGEEGLHLLDPATGDRVSTQPAAKPTSVLYHAGSVYVSGRDGVVRFDQEGQRRRQVAKEYSGELRGADGDHVVLYRELLESRNKEGSPKRLTVVDLRAGKPVYEFKLFAVGWHRVLRVADGRIAFIDFTQRTSEGKNPRKLFYTEANYLHGKKLQDLSLGSRYPFAASDTFWATPGPTGGVLLGNHGAPGEPSALVALDLANNRTLWTRSGEAVAMGILLHRGLIWTGTVDKERTPSVVAYGSEDGKLAFRHSLDGPGTGTPVAAGRMVLLRTRESVYCFAPAQLKPSYSPAPGRAADQTTPDSRSPWTVFRNRALGYSVQFPPSWVYEESKARKLGGVRAVIPFVRAAMVRGRSVSLGTVHLLTWEAAGRDAQGLWKSVYYQRYRANPGLRVVSVRQRSDVGAGRVPGVLAVYSFRNRTGVPTEVRSLCVVSHGVAFELRAWAAPSSPADVWREVDSIFSTFRPEAP